LGLTAVWLNGAKASSISLHFIPNSSYHIFIYQVVRTRKFHFIPQMYK